MPAAAVATKRSGADSKGAGKAMTDTERKLRNLGLVLPEDFVLHLPLRYEDETRVIPISQLCRALLARSKARSPNPKCCTGRGAN